MLAIEKDAEKLVQVLRFCEPSTPASTKSDSKQREKEAASR